MPRPGATRSRGTSLLEALIATSIAALFVGAGASSFGRLLDAIDDDRFAMDLHRAVQLTRSHAVFENVAVTLCPLDANGRCTGDWNQGWTVFRDPERSGTLRGDDRIVRHFQSGPVRGHLRLRAFRTRRYLRMLPNGQTDWQNGRFVYCPPPDRDLAVRTIVINVQGRARMEKRPPDDPLCSLGRQP